MIRTVGGSGPNRIRVARVGAGLTQAQLAEAAGVSRQTVVAMEAGNYAPSVYLALRVAASLATTVEDLFVLPEAAEAPLPADATGPSAPTDPRGAEDDEPTRTRHLHPGGPRDR